MATTSHDEDRVKEATPSSINQKIENETWERVESYFNKVKQKYLNV